MVPFFARPVRCKIVLINFDQAGGGVGANGASKGWYLFSQTPVPEVGFEINGACRCVLINDGTWRYVLVCWCAVGAGVDMCACVCGGGCVGRGRWAFFFKHTGQMDLK